MVKYPSVAIILLNYRSWQHTVACLESLKTLDYPNARIIVVDNASPNDSVTQLEAYLAANPTILGQPVELICSAENGGFSAGCNIGLRRAFQTTFPLSLSPQGENRISEGRCREATGEGDLISSLKQDHPHPNPSKSGISSPLEERGGLNVDYCWLLNNDATVDPGSLKPLVTEAQRTGGLVGSLMLYPDGRPSHLFTSWDGLWSRLLQKPIN